MPFDPESFFQNLAKHGELFEIINRLYLPEDYEKQEKTVGRKDDLLDLALSNEEKKFDYITWEERFQKQKYDENNCCNETNNWRT